MEKETLIITDQGDPSVGIFPQSWEIECPFWSDEENDTKEWFLDQAVLLYREFCDGKCTAEYSSVLKHEKD